jgi:hypothetical protein
MGGKLGTELAMFGSLSIFVTPSLGEWYAGQPLTVGMGLRVGGAVVGIIGILSTLSVDLSCLDSCSNASSSDDTGAALFVIGGAAFVAGVIYDIADAPRAADRYNRAHSLQVAPTFVPTPTGAVPALGLSGTF